MRGPQGSNYALNKSKIKMKIAIFIAVTPNENYFEGNKAKPLALPSFFSISNTKLDATVKNLK